ncbi:MAG: hypothetical protein AB7K09_01935 [Planctomycetota bacterium]
MLAGAPIVGVYFKWFPIEGLIAWFEGGGGATINEKQVSYAFFGRFWLNYSTPKFWDHLQFVFSIDLNVLGMDYGDQYLVDPAQDNSGLLLWFRGDFRLTMRIWI